MKNIKWFKYVLIGIIGILVLGIIIYFIINANTPKVSDFSAKLEQELEYLDKKTLYLINDLNNLNDVNSVSVDKMSTDNASQNTKGKDSSYSTSDESQTSSEGSNEQSSNGSESYEIQNNATMIIDKENIDWEDINSEVEDLYDSWTTITLDLNSANVSNENILAFSENLDNLLISLNNQDKTNSLICLANLYSLIPKYMSETSLNQNEITLENVKSNIVSAYSLVNTSNWEEIKTFLATAETEYDTFMNTSLDSSEIEQSRINRCYVLLKELIKTANLNNADLFYLKYINLMNEIDKIK